MVDIWNSVKNTAKSLGGAAYAPVGAVVDLASMPFDGKDDDFGSVMHALSSRAGDVFDPVFNPQTMTGSSIGKTLEAMNWAYREGISEPVGTVNMVGQHTFGGLAKLGPVGMAAAIASGRSNIGDLFDGKTWSEAYERANQQENALGAAFAYGALTPFGDPLEVDRPYEDIKDRHGALATGTAWTGEIAGMFAGDPAAAALRGAGVLRASSQFAKLGAAEKANLYERITEGSRHGLLRQDLATRTDNYLDFIGGQNKLNRPLSGPEILHGTPELRKYAAEPHVISGLLADANNITDVAARRNAQRRILAVAAGDTSQITRLRTEVAESASIADALANMNRGAVIDLKSLAQAPTLRSDPQFVAALDRQLGNQVGDLDKFMDDWNGRLQQILGTSDTLTHLPGATQLSRSGAHAAGERAILRQNDAGKGRALATAHKKVDEWAAKRALEAQSASTVYQKGLYNLPVVAVKTAGFLASPYTKAPVAVSDALRQVHFTGIANLHDWGGATNQLDSMMRLSKVSHGERLKTLSEAFLAKTEPEKMRIINRVEELSMTSLARETARTTGRDEIDADYIRTLLAEHVTKRDNANAMFQGRAYAATKQSPEMALRTQSAGRAQDAADLEVGRSLTGKDATWGAPERQGNWRVDQINDDGTPLALPLLETQLSNTVPLLDMDIARKVLQRDNGKIARLSRAWKQDALELQRLSEQKAAGAKGLDKLIEAKAASVDWLVSAGQTSMRAWKMGVLFRLGYPMRVLMDDHFRIWSQLNAATFYSENGGEALRNFKYNRLDRRAEGKAVLRDLKVRRQEILEQLDGSEMVSHVERQKELQSIERSMRGHGSQAAKIRKQIEEAETKVSLGTADPADVKALRDKLSESEKNLLEKEGARNYLVEQMGDFGPDDLKRELSEVEELIRNGWKGQAPDKRRLGMADVQLDDGVAIPGSMADSGQVMRMAASSNDSFDNQLRGVEDRMYKAMAGGSHRTLQSGEPGHLHAWADVLNNQLRMSPAAMHFLRGGDVDDFVKWVKAPEQADLRQRLAHFAHDPYDWGNRIQGLVYDYVPTDDLRKALVSGKVRAGRLGRMFPDVSMRPAVHGRAVADNVGSSYATQAMGRGLNRIYSFLGELPTDRLSRHPYFNSMYRMHAREIYATRRAGYGPGYKFTQQDLDDIASQSRKMALRDLKSTLFDVSAHSHAAHLLRFVSPFFAAHQEGVSRWWNIAADNPQIVRRYMQAFDVPRFLGIEVDENGDLVKPGEPLSREHRILLQLPAAFGGKRADDHYDKDGNFVPGYQSNWAVSEQAFNIALQGGLTNPGVGPIVSVPLEWTVERYAQDTQLAKVARIFNPFPPNSPFEGVMPAWYKRMSAYTYGKTGFDPSLIGVGQREYNSAFQQHTQDLMVDFQLKNGREPNSNEAEELMGRAGTEATSQMFHRILWNIGSPAPATPQSKYAAIQHGWYKISEQARAQGEDFDWAYAQFKEKYGSAYIPLIFSTSNNPAWVDSNAATVGALKRYKGLINKVDPAMTRMVIGAYANDLIANDQTLGEYSSDAKNWLRDAQMRTGSDETYYSYDQPAQALEEQMARRGWAKYGELTAGLTAQAQHMGLGSYEDSDELVAIKRAAVDALKAENYAFAKDYDTVDSGQFDRYLGDMRDIATEPSLANDPERTDIQTLQAYLLMRDYFTQMFQQRKNAGYGGFEAQANADLRSAFTQVVNQLVESNLDFEEFMWNGAIDRDPYLLQTTQPEAVAQ